MLEETLTDLGQMRESAASLAEPDSTLAQFIHRGWDMHCEAEIAIKRELEVILGHRPTKITTDWYDNSIEIFGLPVGFVLTAEQKAAVLAFGFNCFWTHEHPDKKREPGERFYPRNSDGNETNRKMNP